MKKLLFCLLFLLLLTAPAYAENGIDVSSVEEGLPEDAREISGELVTDGSYDMRGAIARLADRAKRELAERAGEELREMTRIVAIAVVCTVAQSVCSDSRMTEILSLCACASVVALTVGSLGGLASELTEAIRRLCDYARAALPAVFTASAVSGAVVSAGAMESAQAEAVTEPNAPVTEMLSEVEANAAAPEESSMPELAFEEAEEARL